MEAAAGYCEKISMRDHHQYYYQNCPSFSSTLLDTIYRSIDEAGGGGGGAGAGGAHVPHHQHQHQQRQQMLLYQDITSHQRGAALKGHEPKMGIDPQRAYVIENWKENKGNGKANIHRHSMADLRRSPRSLWNYSSSSSDSSSNKGGFSSSESDYSSRSESKSRSSSSCYSMKKLKPIRTSVSVDQPERPRIIDMLGEDDNFRVNHVVRPSVYKHEGGVVKAKSKALKIYGELKRVGGNNSKQPISPGSKLASFLNSLFNAKKAKISGGCDENFPGKVPKSGYSSTCSTASSVSKSCLSKTPSSRGKLSNNGTKRSVRFCPISVIVDEDSRPCGQKSVMLSDHNLMPKSSVKDQEAETMLRNNAKMRQNQVLIDVDGREEEDEDDDGASCASSDLFELENLSGVGINGIGGGYRYSEELPVYETTNLDTNRAIANGLIV